MAAGDAKATAFWGVAHRVYFPILDADGDLVTGAAGLDSEISKDGGTFADATSEATEIATNSGVYYLDLTATEMEADNVTIIVKTSTTGAKTTVITIDTEHGIRTRKAQAGAAGTITLDASASATNDFYNGLLCRIVGGTGAGQARLVSAYVGSTKVASVVPNWATTPDSTSIFHLSPAGGADVRLWGGAAPNSLISGRVDVNTQAMANDVITASVIADNAIDAASIAADAITAAKIANGAIDAATFAAGAIDAAAIATGAIDADAIAADAITAAKIANGAIDAATYAADTNVYTGKLVLVDDDTGTSDRYVMQWFKNGAPITSGITSPTIQVVKAADGADLIASTAMTEIGSTGAYRYVASGAERIADGAHYFAVLTATIDSGSRTWRQPVGRDS